MRHHLSKMLIIATVLIFSSIFSSSAATAASATTDSAGKQTQSAASKWVRNKAGFYIYYNRQGKKATGLTVIHRKKYFFDKKGIQLCGWQQIGNDYYYFRISNGYGAYLLTNTTVNGIRLDQSGKAVLKKKGQKEKAVLLCHAQQLVRKIITDHSMTKKQKLKVLYDWTQVNSNIQKTNIGGFKSEKADWDVYYAGLVLNASRLPARGDCYTYASTFGYLANALGYEVTVCSSGGHGFVMIDHKFYDPSWQKAMPNSFFGRSWNTVAEGLHFRYQSNMKYKKTI